MTTILPRRGTAAQWTAANPVLAMGELGFETDTTRWKRGDGATAWTALSYYQPSWTDVTAKPAVIAAGADQAAARNAIGALSQIEIENLIGNYESESLALFNRMTVRPDTDHRSAINTLILTLKNTGVWTKLDSLYLFAAHTLQAALLNWVSTSRNLTVYNSPIFTADQGIAGDGISGYLRTSSAFNGAGLKMAQGDESLGLWTRINVADSNQTAISLSPNADGSSSVRYFNPRNSGTNIAWKMNFSTTQGSPAHATGDNQFVVASTIGTDSSLYHNGSLDDTYSAAAVNDPQTQSFYLVIGRVASVYSPRQHSAAFHGSGMTAGDSSNLYNALFDYMTALGALV